MTKQNVPVATEEELVKKALLCLLPILQAKNYAERWAEHSPAVQALTILNAYVGSEPTLAGDLVDVDVLTVHPRPPEADVLWGKEYLVEDENGLIYSGPELEEAKAYSNSYADAPIQECLAAYTSWTQYKE